MKITELMNDVEVDAEFVDKIEFQNDNNISKKSIRKRVFQKIGKENNNLFYAYGRRAIAIAGACAVITAVLFGNYIRQAGTADNSENSFVIYAAAGSNPVLLPNCAFEGAMSADSTHDNTVVSYDYGLPFYCKGNNIKSITYKINQGCFHILKGPYTNSIISTKGAAPEYANDIVGEPDAILCTEFTIDYKLQPKPSHKINTRLIKMIGRKKVVHNAVASDDANKSKLMLDELFKDFKIECTVNYKNGSSQTKKIHVENKIMTCQEACPNEEVAFPDRVDAFMTMVYDD